MDILIKKCGKIALVREHKKIRRDRFLFMFL